MTVPERAEVVVIGGGVIGTSIAFHLAEAGADVLLLERDSLGSGSSSKAAGGVRACFSDPVNVALGLRSLELLADFQARPGGQIDLHRNGYLFALTSERLVDEFTDAVAVQRGLGMRSQVISAGQAREISPLFEWDDVLAACWSPDDGYCTPEAVVSGYAAGARREGAHLATGVTVTGLELGGAAATVQWSSAGGPGRTRCRLVLCCAGAWSAPVAALAGVELPVTPYRRELVVTGPIADLPAQVPMTVDAATSFYLHGEGAGLLAGWSDPDVQPGFDLARDPRYVERLAELAAVRAPRLLEAEIAAGWTGLYEVSPDHNAIVGLGPVEGFGYATGFSGHGFLQGPAVGEVVRDLVLGRRPGIDLSALSVARFGSGLARPERHVV
jgi:sarcosine oxidase subunit beta